MVASVGTTKDGLYVKLHLPQDAIWAITDLIRAKALGQLLAVVYTAVGHQTRLPGMFGDESAERGSEQG